MNKVKNSSFALKHFIVQDFSIKRKLTAQQKVNLKINPTGLYNEETKEYQLTLEIQIKDSNESYTVNMTAIGLFKIKEEETDDARLSNYFYTNAPAVIFPYVRSYISAVTALTGLNTVNLPLMNLSGLRDTLKQQTSRIPIPSEDT